MSAFSTRPAPTAETPAFILPEDLFLRFKRLHHGARDRTRRRAEHLAYLIEDDYCRRVPRDLFAGLSPDVFAGLSREDRWLWLCSVLAVETLQREGK